MQENYIDNFIQPRDFFQKNFALKISGKRTDPKYTNTLKNTCPVCGYLTLEERDAYDICAICFWEDDGSDDSELFSESGPNQMTLHEGREIFQEAKRKLMSANTGGDELIDTLRSMFLNLDQSIAHENRSDKEILVLQNEIIELLTKNKVFGLEKPFDQ